VTQAGVLYIPPSLRCAAMASSSLESRSLRTVALSQVLLHLLSKYWRKRRMVGVLVLGGLGLRSLWHNLAQRLTLQEQNDNRSRSNGRAAGQSDAGTSSRALSEKGSAPQSPKTGRSKGKPGSSAKLDRIFLSRLLRLLPVLVPGVWSKEFILLASQTAMLISRSLLSIHISELIGQGLQAVMRRSPELFARTLADFFISGLMASMANSSLKYLSNLMSAWFRENLTTMVHKKYLHDQNYYRLAVLMPSTADASHRLDNIDQRIVSDLQSFAHTLADLYSRTFKPLLDVILCTQTMAASLGYKGPLMMYSYFVVSSAVLRATSPPLAKLTAQQQGVEGDFRRCHTRLLQHAEEVAFIAGAKREESILNEALMKVSAFTEHLSLRQFQQGVRDEFGLKYFASCIGWPIIALPFIWFDQGADQIEWIARYRVADDLIRQSSTAIGDLLMVHKKLQTLSGYTARVAELVEALDGIHSMLNIDDKFKRSSDVAIEATGVSIETPDGRLLIKDLNMSLKQGDSLVVTGPNGAGKTSLFRVMAGLWPCKDGHMRTLRPAQHEVLFLPQAPYLVVGTLRDQVIYPETIEEALLKMQAEDGTELRSLDEAVTEALKLAGLERFILERGLDRTYFEWDDVLSGGEKQRVGWARLFYHSPAFAALDEATSAINVQVEGPLYQTALQRGITLLSIAHRTTLRQYHRWELNVLGDGSGDCTLSAVQPEPGEAPQTSQQPVAEPVDAA